MAIDFKIWRITDSISKQSSKPTNMTHSKSTCTRRRQISSRMGKAAQVSARSTLWVSGGLETCTGTIFKPKCPELARSYLHRRLAQSSMTVWEICHGSQQGPTLCLDRTRPLWILQIGTWKHRLIKILKPLGLLIRISITKPKITQLHPQELAAGRPKEGCKVLMSRPRPTLVPERTDPPE